MKRLLILFILVAFLFVGFDAAIAKDNGHRAPAPNSGDCNPDGSGYNAPNGPNSSGSGNSKQGYSEPAPNSGDGVSDGSGMDSPKGPNN